MCLGAVARVVEVHSDGRAVVEHGVVEHGAVEHGAVQHGAVEHGAVQTAGRREVVLLMTVADDDIGPGDWVVIHSGFVLERISEARALDALTIRSTAPDVENPDAESPPAADPTADPDAPNPDPPNPDAERPPARPATSAAPQLKEMAP